ncbi:putative protein, chloroplastic-like [Capsicum annuum]|uniref:uncharacterized protein LOC107870931 n=1 Tax=Capsicum annuum TaxID=4072 RepID=UPI0007BF79CF|nr:uncharacterized protein LOC107870931 [Capsicum annuum]XP_016573120.1 uncharacterized protein LOC107870931 [Capsicum annuum]KAF3627420.1 putative protein, chloroplastic-like [Capsicum annuum]
MESSRAISGKEQSQTLGHKDDDVLSESEDERGAEDGVPQLEEEIQKLEQQVNQMADKILDYRYTIPGQLKTTLDSILAAQRPVYDTRQGPESQPGCSNYPSTSDVEGCGASLAGEVQKEAEKAQLLKQKITSNASALPIVLNRMKEGMARIDKLQSSKKVIHSAFKRGRTTR